MDKFVVSARKYRPQNFSTVVGQAHITTTLKNAIRNSQLAHAFLFCGPRGVGKTTCARILAKTINCEAITADGEACNVCPSCLSFNQGTSMNIHELDAASNNSVDDIRALVDQVRFAPQAGKYKVYIIDEVHMLSSSAFNAFLKTLEEPPPYAIFILATTEKHKILPTILSRCQIFDFKRITANDTVDHLREIAGKEEIKADKAALHLIAQKSEGCMRDALSILDKIVSFTNGEVTYDNTLEHLNILDSAYYFKLLSSMQQQDLAGAMLLFDDINSKGFEGDMVIEGMAEFFRNLLVAKDERVVALLEVAESFRERYLEVAAQTSFAYIISALNILNDAGVNYKSARNKRLHAELCLIRLSYLQQAMDIAASGEGLVKKKAIDAVKPVAFRRIPLITVPKSREQPAVKTVVPEEMPRATLLVETPLAKKTIPAPTNQLPETQPGTGRLGGLANIRKQFAKHSGTADATAPVALTDALLREAWGSFTVQLKASKNPAGQSFDLAELRIKDEKSFDIVTPNNLQLKFIESERVRLSEYLQEKFNNRSLTFYILIDENAEPPEKVELPLNTREQYQMLVEKYPLVKELKDRLRLDLEY